MPTLIDSPCGGVVELADLSAPPPPRLDEPGQTGPRPGLGRGYTQTLMPVFICPRCAYRERGADRHVRHQPRGCSRCGFGFAFELLEDYYAGPKTALIVCDQERRILAGGHASFAVTGYQDDELIGHEVVERLGMTGFAERRSGRHGALKWGVRQLEVDCTFRPKGVDEDRPGHGGLLPRIR